MNKNRIEAFSDGVFAVALTLLVLDLHVPVIASHSNFHEHIVAISPLIPNVLAFILTFAIVAIHWVSHHYLFMHLRIVPVGFVWLNNLFLLWICFMPFPTAMLGEHPIDQFPVLLYAINQLLASLTFFAFRHCAIHNKLFAKTIIEKTMGPRHSIPAVVIFIVSILFVFINIYVSLTCFLIVPVLYFVPYSIDSKIFHSFKKQQ